MIPMRFNGPQEMLDNLAKQDFIRNNPVKQGYLNTLQEAFKTGDMSKAEALANNICQSHGKSPQEMFQMVMGSLIRRQ